MKQRIVGIDLARALAVIGMIIVNFKVVLGDEGTHWVKKLASIFDGKAAATFVVLAGVGLALMTNVAIQSNQEKLRIAKIRIAKRAVFLFMVGLSYIPIWPADILRFYGVYMVITLLLLRGGGKVLIGLAMALIFIFPLLTSFWDYELGWDFETFKYQDFWTFSGFFRNLFFNGFHPVIPWCAFMLAGLWFGQQDLQSHRFVKKAFWISCLGFIGIQVLSVISLTVVSEGDQTIRAELVDILGTEPMPPFPLYMFNGIAIAISVVTGCILLAKRFENSRIIEALNKTGQLALTFYVMHVVIGMGVIEVIAPSKVGQLPIEFSVAYAIIFSLGCILFAVIWRKHKKAGPLEWVMRKLTD